MKAKIEIDMNNDAFRNTPSCAANELARILGRLEDDVSRYVIGEIGLGKNIVDYNGNTVGKLEIIDDEPEEYLSAMIDGDDNHYRE